MTRIITIANQKGGCGKTTTAAALAAGLRAKGYRTLAVDSDPQSNLTLNLAADDEKPGLYEVLKGSITAIEAIQDTSQGHVIGASLMLASADIEFNSLGRAVLLSEALEPIKKYYDFIVIDTPPALGILTVNALAAAQDVIITVGADVFSLHGFGQLNKTISEVKRHCNPGLKVAGILITRYSGRAILSQELRETIANKAAQIGTGVFSTAIREGIAVKEAQARRESIFTGRSNAAADYSAFVDEYLKGVGDIEP